MRPEERRAWTDLAERSRQAALVSQAPARARPDPVQALQLLAGSKPTKHGNTRTEVNGYTFASRLEADRYRELVVLRQSGQVAWFIRQVPFDVAPGVVYRADFLVVCNLDGSARQEVHVEETKGHLTDTARVKLRVVEERYGIQIRILTRKDVHRW
jgi:hypothetical protein